LTGRFAPCLTRANQCGLSQEEGAALEQAMELRGRCYDKVEFVADITPAGFSVKGCDDPIQFQSAYLYQENGQPVSALEMTAFALEAMSVTCNSYLVGRDQSRIVKAAMEYTYFQGYNVGDRAYLVAARNSASGSHLTVETAGKAQDLTPLFRDTLNLGPAGKVDLSVTGSDAVNGVLKISGFIERNSQVPMRLAFEITQKGGAFRLLVY
jgi:hypothetical protein